MTIKSSDKHLTDKDPWFRYCSPYHFTPLKLTKGRYIYLPVNRSYKPLGITTREPVNYEDFFDLSVEFFSDPHGFDDVWYDAAALYLYNDSPASTLNYYVRLRRLELFITDRSMKLANELGLGLPSKVVHF